MALSSFCAIVVCQKFTSASEFDLLFIDIGYTKRMLRLLIISIGWLCLSSSAQAQVLEGTAVAIDGDTIDMTGMRIRLVGIDAPEAAQTCQRDEADWECGREASKSLASLIDSEAIVCIATATDVYGRRLARCRTRVFDLGQEQLRRGMAIATAGSPPEYQDAVAIAQRLGSGIWSSRFDTPADWRAANEASAPDAKPQRAQNLTNVEPRNAERVYRNENGCLIKGNRSRRGGWIYHLPGRPYYDQTTAEEMFCTESEAQSAGYRRSRAG